MKRGIIYLFLAFILISSQTIFAQSTKKPIQKEDKRLIFVEYYWIYIKLYKSQKTEKELVEQIYPEVIQDFKNFIKAYPKSFLTDDAKLRIAEIYNLSGLYSHFFTNIQVDTQWLEKANFWLLDILKNHPRDKYFSTLEAKETSDFTAAWALYYLGIWNKNVFYLKKLIEEYPESEPTKFVKSKLEGGIK